MRVNGAVTLDLRDLDDYHAESDRDGSHKLKNLVYAPAGADVHIYVKPRQLALFQGLDYIRRHGDHLGAITIHSEDATTVSSWVKALRDGTF